MSVVVRFAPSPTGMLHIGNARTALFNYLFARHHKGKFLLRIEDTDKERSTEQAVEAIFDGLKWLGIDYNGEVVFQSARIERHKELAYQLLEAGKAYRCFCDENEIEKLRHDSRSDNEKIIYPDRDQERFSANEKPFVIRLKTPITGEMTINDVIRGEVTIDACEIDDMVLLRSDGTPTYMHAVVCDDIDMGITHIIRGEDHLINAFRQSYLYEAFEKTPPIFAHLPLIHGSDGAKLSKRHGATSVSDWRLLGYTPETLVNYLITLGWNDLNKDMFSLDEAIDKFNLEKVNNSAARLDIAKMNFLSGLYIRSFLAPDLVSRYHHFYREVNKQTLSQEQCSVLIQAVPLFNQRATTLKEFGEITKFLISDDAITPDTKSKELLSDSKNIYNLKNLMLSLETLDVWSNDRISETFKQFLSDYQLKMPNIGPVIRASVAGTVNTPDIVGVLALLGQEKTLSRIKQTIADFC